MSSADAIKVELDTTEFWLLARKFSTSPAGDTRDAAKEAVLTHVAEVFAKVGAL